LEADVRGQRSRGRQRKRWIDVVKYNMEDMRVDLMDVGNRAEWRRRTRVADPKKKKRRIVLAEFWRQTFVDKGAWKDTEKWIDVVRYNVENLWLDLVDVENRAE